MQHALSFLSDTTVGKKTQQEIIPLDEQANTDPALCIVYRGTYVFLQPPRAHTCVCDVITGELSILASAPLMFPAQ